ncbi:hypothetical protein [Streptomyces sp. CA-111067]|uniref:hypothetical protein n=1 Tax=Streptomyces sp. CA-111067 TaxID=3240046 RepID=UPI003D97740B
MAEARIDLKIPGLDALATDLKRLTDVLDADDNTTAAVAVRAIQLMRQAGDERDKANAELGAARDQRDGAYRERAQLLAWLAALHPAVIAPALDLDEPGWWILYLAPPIGGQLSWHISPRDAGLLTHVERVEPDDPRAQWDGHTTDEKYGRIQVLTSALVEVEADDEDEFDDAPTDSDSDVFALISEIASRLTDATDDGEYQAAGLIGDLANGRKTIAEARTELADITFRHV